MKPGTYAVSIKYQYGQDLFANLTVPVIVPGEQLQTAKLKRKH